MKLLPLSTVSSTPILVLCMRSIQFVSEWIGDFLKMYALKSKKIIIKVDLLNRLKCQIDKIIKSIKS